MAGAVSPNRQKALAEILEHIARFGFHTYVVTGGGDPHFGYTIGLTQTCPLLSCTVENACSGEEQQSETFTIDPWGNLTNKGPVARKTNYENLAMAPTNNKNQLKGRVARTSSDDPRFRDL